MNRLVVGAVVLAATVLAFGAGWQLANSKLDSPDATIESKADPNEEDQTAADRTYIDWQRAESRRLATEPEYARQKAVASIQRELNLAGYCVGETEAGKIDPETVSQLITFSKMLGVDPPDLETATYDLITEFATQISLWQPEPPPAEDDWARYFSDDTIPWPLSVDAVSGCWRLEGEVTEETVDELYMSIWRYERGAELTTADWLGGINGSLNPSGMGFDESRFSWRALASPFGLRPYGLQGFRYSRWVTHLQGDETLIHRELGCYPDQPPRTYKKVTCPM